MSRERIENTFGLRLLFGEWIEGKKVRKQSTPVCIFLFFHRAHGDENNNNNDDDLKATRAKSNRVAKKNKNIGSCCVRIRLILIWIEQKVDKPTAITAFFSANFSICFFMFFLFFQNLFIKLCLCAHWNDVGHGPLVWIVYFHWPRRDKLVRSTITIEAQ